MNPEMLLSFLRDNGIIDELQMGDLLEGEDALPGEADSTLRQLSKRLKPPRVDDTLYDL